MFRRGFYTPSGYPTTTNAAAEPCRSCTGSGIVILSDVPRDKKVTLFNSN
jgi:hypothetical protein